MTINELSTQLFNLSVGGYFNHEKFSLSRLRTYISKMLRTSDTLIMEIALPDGWWYFEIFNFENKCLQYNIPDTRQQEARIKARLFPASK